MAMAAVKMLITIVPKMSDVVPNGTYVNGRENDPRTCAHVSHSFCPEISLFCPEILKSISFSQENLSKFNPPISPANPGDGLLIRPLKIDDYEKGYIELLGQLTETGALSQADFERTFRAMKSAHNTYFIVVAEDLNSGRIVGSTTLLIEQKFIHDAGLRGRIEDVVVDNAYRSRQLGKLLVETCTELGKRYFKCYKMSLDCKEHLTKFYGAFGYKPQPGNNVLFQRFDGK